MMSTAKLEAFFLFFGCFFSAAESPLSPDEYKEVGILKVSAEKNKDPFQLMKWKSNIRHTNYDKKSKNANSSHM